MTNTWRAQRRRREALRAVLLATALVMVLFPLGWTALAAIGILPNNNTSPPSLIGAPSIAHVAEVTAVEPAFWQELTTSVAVAAIAALIGTALSFLAAYGIARSSSATLRRLAPSLLILASLPAMAYVLPLSDLLRRVGLLDTVAGLVLAETAATAPLAVYVLSAHLLAMSKETEDAARLDGASLSRLLRTVVLPAATPIVAATAIVLFVLDWNMLLLPLVLTGIDVRTLPVILTDFFTLEREVEWSKAAAGLIISLVPLLIVVGGLHGLLERFSLAAEATDAS